MKINISSDYMVVNDEFSPWLDEQPSRTVKARAMFQNFLISGENEIQSRAPIGASSVLFNSIPAYTKLEQSQDAMTGFLGSDVEYAYEQMETGVPPGRKINMESLRRWANSKNIKNVGGVARKIKRFGTKQYRDGGYKKVTEAFREINKLGDKMINNIIQLYR